MKTGHDFSNYKRATVLRRIERRMNVRELKELAAYSSFIREQPDEAKALLKDLLISVTNFYRDRDAFDALEQKVLPRIFEGKSSGSAVRVWTAGCATGEEAYSMAMLLAERSFDVIDAPKVQVFATDIDETAIAQARDGFYTLNDAADVSPERLRRFFIKEKDGYRVRREIREMVLFAAHNLIKDPPFSHLDLFSCRNLLIYLNRAAQARVMEIAHFALNPGAYLFLGSSESIDGGGDLFTPFDRENHIYQSRPVMSRVALPVPDLSPTMRFDQTPQSKISREQEKRALERLSSIDLHQQLLEQYAPPSILVNEEYDILHVSERAGRFLHITGGEPSYNLLKVIREEIRLELRTALYQAVQNRVSVETGNLKLKIGDRDEIINIHVRPVLRKDDAARGFMLVVFSPSYDDDAESATQFVRSDEPLARQLEEELTRVKTRLRLTTEQYETQTEELTASNEELQAMNEELRSAAEELETGKEELQSLNEELTTVNQELKIKIEEISQSNNNFQNLMNSTAIGTMFLDRSLRIKMFTPNMRDVFNLIPSDLGRSLTDITGKLDYADLLTDIELVLEKLQPVERETRTADGRWHLTRILPYRTAEDRIDGVILTFVDITARKKDEESIRLQARLLEAVNQAVIATDMDGRVIYWNEFAQVLYGWTAREAIGRDALELITPPEMIKNAARLMNDLRRDKSWSGEIEVKRRDGATFPAQAMYSLIEGGDGNPVGIVGVSIDISERRRTDEALRSSEDRMRLIVESATDYAILTLSKDNLITSWNRGAENIFGYTEKEIIGKSNEILFTPEDRAKGVPEKERLTALKKGRAEDERWHIRRDGTRFYASGVMTLLKNGGIEGFAKIARDQTEKIAAEKTLREKETLQRLIAAQEDERKRIARDLHDHLGQQLTALRLKLDALKQSCEKYDDMLCGQVEEAQIVSRSIDADVDFLAWELRPSSLDELGLRATLLNFVREWSRHVNVNADFHTSGIGRTRLDATIEINLYRIAQEALNNIYKHADAKNVSVLLEKRKANLVLIIEDDGKGFNPQNKKTRSKGLGLIGMAERAALLGGTLEIESEKGKGTTIFARVPLAK